MPRRIDNSRHWRARAEEARELAEQMTNPEAKRIMLGIAVSYVGLAQIADQREEAKRK
jgi:hypothetical protein